jgi:hypothetical protein
VRRHQEIAVNCAIAAEELLATIDRQFWENAIKLLLLEDPKNVRDLLALCGADIVKRIDLRRGNPGNRPRSSTRCWPKGVVLDDGGRDRIELAADRTDVGARWWPRERTGAQASHPPTAGQGPLVGEKDDPLDLSHVEFFLNRGHLPHGARRSVNHPDSRPAVWAGVAAALVRGGLQTAPGNNCWRAAKSAAAAYSLNS